ncbi:MAG: cysteine desulfurase family protein [Bacillota bacterium]
MVNNREIYLDNSATTPVFEDIADRMREIAVQQYGNPSSLHRKGIEAEILVTEARMQISKAMEVRPEEIVFTSGGTEANNLALLGSVEANRRNGKRIISSEIEHPSVLETLKRLEQQGYEVLYCPVDACGRVTPDALSSLVNEDTILVTIMMVNNEIGTVEPMAELVRAAKKVNPRLVFHSDCVQAFGKIPLNPVKIGLDLVSLSAHKLHGPKGVGVLYINSRIALKGQISGGGQERKYRSGTENVSGIVGFGMAADRAVSGMSEHSKLMNGFKSLLIKRLQEQKIEFRLNGPPIDEGAPHIINLSFPGTWGEVLVHFLESQKIYVSTGSACHSRKADQSHVLKAIRLPKREAEGSIRISFSVMNTEEDIETLAQELASAIRRLKARR